jgi:hypothetical protein
LKVPGQLILGAKIVWRWVVSVKDGVGLGHRGYR